MRMFFIVIFISLFVVPASASIDIPVTKNGGKISIYTQLRLVAGYQNTTSNNGSMQNANGLIYQIQSNSRFGIDFKYGKVFTRAEFGYNSDKYNETSLFRQLYIGYNFNKNIKLTVGRQFAIARTDLNFVNVFNTDNGLKGYGSLGGTNRIAGIKLNIYDFDLFIVSQNAYYNRGRYIDAISGLIQITNDPNFISFETDISATLDVADKIIPAIEAAYNFKLGLFKGRVFGSYAGANIQASDIRGNAQGTPIVIDEPQKSWISAATTGLEFKLNYAGFKSTLAGYYALNGDIVGKVRWGINSAIPINNIEFSSITKAELESGAYDDIFSGIKNVHTVGIAGVVGYDIAKSFNLAIGGGFQLIFSDSESFMDYGSLLSYSVYLIGRYKINTYLSLLPTVGYYNNYSTAQKAVSVEGKEVLTKQEIIFAGIQFRITL